MDNNEFNAAMQSLTQIRESAGLNLQGRLYSMVKDRVEIFRRHFGSTFRIDTDVAFPDGLLNGCPVIATAKITDANGLVVASGHAMERVGATKITATNPIEMAETSAIGRALACFGLAGGEYASGDELVSAIGKQNALKADATVRENINVGPEAPQVPVKKATNTSGLYVPEEHDAAWSNPQAELNKVIDSLKSVTTAMLLGKYWSDLEFFRGILERDDPAMVGALKAAFAQRNNQLTV